MKIDLAKPKPPPPPREDPPPPKSPFKLFDGILVLFLAFAVWHQTPIGDVPAYLSAVYHGQETASFWRPQFQRRDLAPLQFATRNSGHSEALPINLQKAADRLGLDREFLGTVAFTLGACDAEDCRIPAPPHLSEVLGALPTTPVVPIHTLAKGIKAAANELRGNSDLALEALFLGVANVRRAMHFSRIAGRPDPETIEQHLGYFPSHVPRGTIETVRSVLANHRLWHLQWPVPAAHKISSPFGTRVHPVTRRRHLHNGMDIPASVGVPVVAAQDGQVIRAGRDSLNGNYLKIVHGFGIETVYCHLDSLSVGSGHKVTKGTQVGTVGETGRVTGPHLHFTLKLNNEPVDPTDYPWKKHQSLPRAGLLPN